MVVLKETIEALNDSLDDNEEVYSNESKEKSKDIESQPAYYILLYPLGNKKIEKVVFTRLRLSTSILYNCDGHNLSNLYHELPCVFHSIFRDVSGLSLDKVQS